MGKSYLTTIIILSLFLLLFVSSVSAEVEEHVYVTFNGNNAHVKQVVTVYASPGYFLPSFKYSEFFAPTYQKNLVIHDANGKPVNYKIIEQNENYTYYEITVPQVGSSYTYGVDFLASTYYIYYEYDIENVINNYLKNYEATFYLRSKEDTYTREIYFCLPKGATSPIEYDSRPAEATDYNNYNPNLFQITKITPPNFTITKITPFGAPSEPEPNFCSNGVKETVYSTSYSEGVDLVNHRWSDPNSARQLKILEGNKVTISLPEGYTKDYEYLKKIEGILPYLDSEGLKQQDHYYLYFVDKEDKVLTYDTKKEGIICYENGNCYLSSDILPLDDQFQALNLISSMFLTSYIKSYGIGMDTQNWFIQGSSDFFAIKSMEQAKLNNDKIKEYLDSINAYDTSDIYDSSISSEISGESLKIKNAKIVGDIDSLCPGHISDVTKSLKEDDLLKEGTNENEFNNRVLIYYSDYCDIKGIADIFQKKDLKFNREKVETYVNTKKDLDSISGFNLFKGLATTNLKDYLNQDGQDADSSLKSAIYWKNNGMLYSIGLIIGVIILIVGLIIGCMYYFKKRKHRVKEHSRYSQHEETQEKKMDTSHNLNKEVKNSGIILIVLGFLHFLLSGLLDPLWGVVLIIVGIISLIYRSRNMLLVFGILLILVGILNIFSSISSIETSSFWFIFAGFQIYWGIKEIIVFTKTK